MVAKRAICKNLVLTQQRFLDSLAPCVKRLVDGIYKLGSGVELPLPGVRGLDIGTFGRRTGAHLSSDGPGLGAVTLLSVLA
jgi:hypothetical protein